jgi:predicted NBD/HSP70 family sugar kinase
MKHFIGLDVSVKETAVCIVDDTGRIYRELRVVSHPDDLLAVLKDPALDIERVLGLEAGPFIALAFRGAGERRVAGHLH